MELSQELIDAAVRAYSEATQAHKRAPVERFVHKQLLAGEAVTLSSGTTRWSSALVFSGTPKQVEVTFAINDALPEHFKEHLQKTQQSFKEFFTQEISA